MKINTIKGTNDYLPQEAALRDYIQTTILGVYKANGFVRIMTPAVEDIENLNKSDGGDNLNLIFKILKRGDKLDAALKTENPRQLSDMGLRYDLTLPLSRYFANNRNDLMLPFKCIQIDKVYRAEKPQKGRLREFLQCDIDIIGSESRNCEMELITVTANALLQIGLRDFTVRINDRVILTDLLTDLGFPAEDIPSVCITFDKLDKIGVAGVKEELEEKKFEASSIDALIKLLGDFPLSLDVIKSKVNQIQRVMQLENIIEAVRLLSGNQYNIEFDLSLVRGQGYYTGTIFEIASPAFKGAIAGGGRYDDLIGKFVNDKVPAVGFSIGFEKIFCILKDNGFIPPDNKKKIALLYLEDFIEASRLRETMQAEYDVTLYETPKKLSKFLSQLQKSGYYGFITCDQAADVKVLKS